MRQKRSLESDRFMDREEVPGDRLEDSEGLQGAGGHLEYCEAVGGNIGVEDHHSGWIWYHLSSCIAGYVDSVG